MKRRFVCLFLSILMLMTVVLTGCSTTPKDGSTEEEVDNSAKTIVMWVMEPENIPEEDRDAYERAQKLVQEEFSKITKAKYKTNVVLKFVSPDEYFKQLEEAIAKEETYMAGKEEAASELELFLKGVRSEDREAKIEEFYATNPQYEQYRATIEDEQNKGEDDEYETNEWGVKQTKYPAARDGQVDIFYLQGYNADTGRNYYEDFYEKGYLANLSSDLELSAKKLTDYIATSLLSGIQRGDGVYAIPNNIAIGEYTYALIDKEIFESTANDPYAIENVVDLERFFGDIMIQFNQGKTPEDEGYVVPLASSFQECMDMLVWYWDLSYTDRTVYETYYDEESGRNYVLGCKYTVKVEDEDTGEEIDQLRVIPFAKQDQLYKVNAEGKYVNAEGKVLNYRYVTDDTYRYQVDGLEARLNGVPKTLTPVEVKGINAADLAKQAGGMYLVDEDKGGLPVTPENDERVIMVNGEVDDDEQLLLDDDGVPMIPELFDDEGNQIWVGDEIRDEDGNLIPRVALTTYYGKKLTVNDKGEQKEVWAQVTLGEDVVDNTYYNAENGDKLLVKGEDGLYYNADGDRVSVTVEVGVDTVETSNNVDAWVRQTFFYSHNENADFSLLGTVYKDPSKISRGEIELNFTSLMTDPEYQRIYSTLKKYEFNGYYGTPDASKNQTAAVQFVKGNAAIKYISEQNDGVYKDESGKEYYVFVAKYPEASTEELYGNMFAVYAGSNNLTRCMEVLTRLNTDPELRNLLQYGVPGKHYVQTEKTLEDGSKVILAESLLGESRESAEYKAYGKYRMDIEKTGNSFLVYPTVYESAYQGADAWVYAKLQNSDSLINPLMDFDFNVVTRGSEYNMDTALIDYIQTESATVQAALQECTDADAMEDLLTSYSTAYLGSKNANIRKVTRYDYDPAKDGADEHVNATRSPYEVYVSWLTSYGYKVDVTKNKTEQ